MSKELLKLCHLKRTDRRIYKRYYRVLTKLLIKHGDGENE